MTANALTNRQRTLTRTLTLWVVLLLLSLGAQRTAQAQPTDALQAMLKRVSVRLYDDKPVTDGQLNTIIQAGWNAKTVDSSRPFEFMVIRDRQTLEQLAGATKFAKWMTKAPAAIAVITRRDESPKHHVENGIQAVTNMYYAAQQLGLGTCFVGTAKRWELRKILGLTGSKWKGRHLLTLLPVGVPKSGKNFKSPARVPLKETVFEGRVGQPASSLDKARPAKQSGTSMAALLQGPQQEITAFNGWGVSKRKLRTALDGMRAAQSSKNRQPWRVVLLRDPAAKRELAKATGDPLLAKAPVVAVLATSLKPPPRRFGSQEQKDPHNNVRPGTRLTRHFIRRHDPSFALANLRLGLESQGLGAKVVMLNSRAGDVARQVLSSGRRPIGKRNLHMLAAIGIGHVKKGGSRTLRAGKLPQSRVFKHTPRAVRGASR
jgi:nitroreductase